MVKESEAMDSGREENDEVGVKMLSPQCILKKLQERD